MGEAEQLRQQNRRGPITHASSQSKLKISAKGEFLTQANDHEGATPRRDGEQQSAAVSRDPGQMKACNRKIAKSVALIAVNPAARPIQKSRPKAPAADKPY